MESCGVLSINLSWLKELMIDSAAQFRALRESKTPAKHRAAF